MTNSALPRGTRASEQQGASEQQRAASSIDAAAGGDITVEKCVDCQYYDRRNAKPTDGKATMWGQCRRHSPHLNPVTAKAYVVEGVWPLVRDDDWCGEWRTLTRAVDDWVPATETVATQGDPVRTRPAATVAAAVVALAGDD